MNINMNCSVIAIVSEADSESNEFEFIDIRHSCALKAKHFDITDEPLASAASRCMFLCIQTSWRRSWEGFFTSAHRVLVLEVRIVCALLCSSAALLKSLSGRLSAHVIEGPVAIYEEFYISGSTTEILPSFQTPRVLYSVRISLHMQQEMQFLVYTFHTVKQKE